MSSEKNRLRDCLAALTRIVDKQELTEHLKASPEMNSCITAYLTLSKKLFEEGNVPSEYLNFQQGTTNVCEIFRVLKSTLDVLSGTECTKYRDLIINSPEWKMAVSSTVKLLVSILRDSSNASRVDSVLWAQLVDLIQGLLITQTRADSYQECRASDDACVAIITDVEQLRKKCDTLIELIKKTETSTETTGKVKPPSPVTYPDTVTVARPDGSTFKAPLRPWYTTQTLMNIIQGTIHHSDNIQLYFEGQKMAAYQVMSNFNIQPSSVINVVTE